MPFRPRASVTSALRDQHNAPTSVTLTGCGDSRRSDRYERAALCRHASTTREDTWSNRPAGRSNSRTMFSLVISRSSVSRPSWPASLFNSVSSRFRSLRRQDVPASGRGAFRGARPFERRTPARTSLLPLQQSGPRGPVARFEANDNERLMLAWLKTYAPAPESPEIYLGYGQDDRFAAASELLAERLPAARVLAMAGGHDWATWITLWRHWIAQDLFTGAQQPPRKPARSARQKPSSHEVL